MAVNQVQKVNHRHEAIIDWLLANPDVKNLQILCDSLNVSRSWLSVVMNSDAFKVEYQRRREEYNTVHAATVQKKLYEVSIKALDEIAEHLDGVEEVDPRFALDVVDKATNRLGFGPAKGNAPQVALHADNVHVVDKSLLEVARQSMREVIDVESEEG